jgi:RNA polymerase sigma-70 factor (ECF subfamily)
MSLPDSDANASDRLLIAQLRDGDPAALEKLMRSYGDRLIRYAARRVESVERAREVVQDVFLAIWRDRATLSVSRDLAAYLFWRTRNHAIHLAQADRATHDRDRRWTTEMRLTQDSEGSAELGALEAEETETRIRRALGEVPPRCREVFLLVWDEHLSYAEVAAVLGIAIPSVRSQMSRAIKHLLEVL